MGLVVCVALAAFLAGAYVSTAVHGEWMVAHVGSETGPCVAYSHGTPVGAEWPPRSDGHCWLSDMLWRRVIALGR